MRFALKPNIQTTMILLSKSSLNSSTVIGYNTLSQGGVLDTNRINGVTVRGGPSVNSNTITSHNRNIVDREW
jgi:hypothetical protein